MSRNCHTNPVTAMEFHADYGVYKSITLNVAVFVVVV